MCVCVCVGGGMGGGGLNVGDMLQNLALAALCAEKLLCFFYIVTSLKLFMLFGFQC